MSSSDPKVFQDRKDKVMFLSEEELKKPSSVVLPEDDEPHGLLLPNGEINWACPCLGNMVVGPCSIEFRESLSCFHKSTAEPKGSDCLEQFREMNDCMARYPGLYKKNDDDDEKLSNLEAQSAINSSKDADDSNSAIQETSKVANV